MSNLVAYEKLDQAIDQMLASSDAAPVLDGEIAELAQLAADLRDLPRENFQARLRLELEWEAAGRAVTMDAAQTAPERTTEVLPSLFGKNWGGYPMRRSNFALSAALHALMMLMVGAGFVMVKNMPRQADRPVSISYRIEPYIPPAGTHESGGGGSGGAAEKFRASKGMVPRSQHVPLAPPIIEQTDIAPKLAVKPAVIAPPELNLPKDRQIGDPLSTLALASNGAGVHAGFGGNRGAGVGSGDGPGIGNGVGGGCCEGTYLPGNGVTMPRAIYAPEPEFSDEARKVKHQGEVTLLAVIGADGLPKRLTVVRSLGMGLDEKALEAVRTWRFEPARKGGSPVAVQMNIVVNFHLY